MQQGNVVLTLPTLHRSISTLYLIIMWHSIGVIDIRDIAGIWDGHCGCCGHLGRALRMLRALGILRAFGTGIADVAGIGDIACI